MGRSPACSSNYTAERNGAAGSLKKGAWTPEEDEKLVSFIEKNKGHGSWRTLPHLAGLQRCGKSCRLRWTNYLRPNIKRGNFSVEEERTISQLHALLGNKWSSIASHLPGRTDNEVKNHWNTHMKKRLTRMGIDPATHRPSCAAVDHSNLMQALMSNMMRPNSIQLQINGDSSLTLNAAPPSCTAAIPDPADIISSNSHAHPHVALRRPAAGPKPATSVARPNFSITPLPVDTSFVTHMAQWELARLEAEARLAATSTSSSASARRPRSTELSHLMKSSGRSISCASGTNFPSWRDLGSSGALAPNERSEKSSSSSSSAIACKRYMVNKARPPDNQIILQALTEMLSVSVLSMPGNDSTEESASILSLPSLGASSTSCASASSKSKQSTNGAADDDHNSTDNDNIPLQNMMSSGVNITAPAAGSGGAAIKDVVLERSSWSSSIRSGCTADDAENSAPNNLQRSGCKTITSDCLQNLMMLDVDEDLPLDVDLMIISPEPATSHHISMDQMVIRAQAPAVPLFDLMNVNNIHPAGASPDQPCESSGSPAAYWAHLLNGLVLGPSSSTLSSCS